MCSELTSDYAGVYGNKIGFGLSPAIILVDFVEAYFNRDCELYAGVESALDSAERIRDAARALDLLVIYTNVVYDRAAINGGRFFQKALPLRNFIEGNPMGAWPAGLNPREDEIVISKQYPSAFFGTSLPSTLTANGIDTLIITGLTTSGCVRATCVDCISYGFIPIIVSDACGDRHRDPHNASLFDMDAKYGDVVGEQEAIDYLNQLRPKQNN